MFNNIIQRSHSQVSLETADNETTTESDKSKTEINSQKSSQALGTTSQSRGGIFRKLFRKNAVSPDGGVAAEAKLQKEIHSKATELRDTGRAMQFISRRNELFQVPANPAMIQSIVDEAAKTLSREFGMAPELTGRVYQKLVTMPLGQSNYARRKPVPRQEEPSTEQPRRSGGHPLRRPLPTIPTKQSTDMGISQSSSYAIPGFVPLSEQEAEIFRDIYAQQSRNFKDEDKAFDEARNAFHERFPQYFGTVLRQQLREILEADPKEVKQNQPSISAQASRSAPVSLLGDGEDRAHILDQIYAAKLEQHPKDLKAAMTFAAIGFRDVYKDVTAGTDDLVRFMQERYGSTRSPTHSTGSPRVRGADVEAAGRMQILDELYAQKLGQYPDDDMRARREAMNELVGMFPDAMNDSNIAAFLRPADSPVQGTDITTAEKLQIAHTLYAEMRQKHPDNEELAKQKAAYQLLGMFSDAMSVPEIAAFFNQKQNPVVQGTDVDAADKLQVAHHLYAEMLNQHPNDENSAKRAAAKRLKEMFPGAMKDPDIAAFLRPNYSREEKLKILEDLYAEKLNKYGNLYLAVRSAAHRFVAKGLDSASKKEIMRFMAERIQHKEALFNDIHSRMQMRYSPDRAVREAAARFIDLVPSAPFTVDQLVENVAGRSQQQRMEHGVV